MAILAATFSKGVMKTRAMAGDAALMEYQLTATGKPVAVICAANRVADESVEVVPFAMLSFCNLYRTVNPPKPSGGFYSQEEVSHV